MKIAQVCPYDIDRPGGVQAHIRDTADAFAKLGHDVTIIAPRIGANVNGPSESPSVRFMRLGRARKISFGATSFEISALGEDGPALDALMREGFDIVHFHTIWVPLLPFQVFRRFSGPKVATFHDTPADTLSGTILRQIFSRLSTVILPRLDAVIAVSDAPTRHLRAAHGVPIQIVPPCTDLAALARAAHGRAEAKAGGVNILFLGRLDTRKGAMLLLRAYRRLAAQAVPVTLTIAGMGDDADALRQYVREHALAGVDFLGAVPAQDKARVIASCDIFCAPAPYGESFGIVIAEAMACGKPVVAAGNAGYRTILKDESASCLAAPGDVDSLYQKLRALVLHADDRARLGAWGAREALRYDCSAVAPRLLAIYRQAQAKRA